MTTQPEDLSTVQLIDRLTAQVRTLVRSELAHGVDEMKTKGTRMGVGAGVSGAGALLLYLGAATLIAAAVLGLTTALDPWLAALIIGAAVVVVGAVLTAVGARTAKNAVPPVPEDTAGSVRTDVEVAREALR